MSIFAPGARVVIRDEEWLVRRVDTSSDGGYLLSCDGLSDLVRGRSVQFLTKLEEDIVILDPAETELVADTSSHFNSTFLYIEALQRRSIPNDRGIHLGHRGVMNLVPYQLSGLSTRLLTVPSKSGFLVGPMRRILLLQPPSAPGLLTEIVRHSNSPLRQSALILLFCSTR